MLAHSAQPSAEVLSQSWIEGHSGSADTGERGHKAWLAAIVDFA